MNVWRNRRRIIRVLRKCKKESEFEEEDMLCRMFDGWIFCCHYNESIKIELNKKTAGIRD